MHPVLPAEPEHFPAPPASAPPLLAGPDHRFGPADAADAAVAEQLLAERIVVVGGDLDDDAARRLVARLLLLDAIDQRRDITLHLASVSGTATAALAVRDVMAHVAPDVVTWAVGLVSSTAQVLLSAGARGKRHALPHARVQLRRPTVGPLGAFGGAGPTHDELRAELTALTAGDCGQPVATVTADLGGSRWFTAEQARDYGLVDHVGGTGG